MKTAYLGHTVYTMYRYAFQIGVLMFLLRSNTHEGCPKRENSRKSAISASFD
jgi:hypothetical protein